VIVIANEGKMEIGTRHIGRATDKNCEWCDVGFVVLREATKDEYERAAVENGASEYDAKRPFPLAGLMRFYEVAMD
jgi:hypothetical protein